MGNEHEDLVKTLRQCSMLATILLSCWFVPRAHTALNSDEREENTQMPKTGTSRNISSVVSCQF